MEEISIGELVAILKKRFVLIIIMLVLGIAIATGVTFFLITPMYGSSAELIVQSKGEATTNLQADVNANVLLINTYADMIKGDVVLDDVQKELAENYQYDLSTQAISGIIEVVQSTNSQMFQIRATSDNPDKSAAIANVTAAIFQNKAADVLDVNRVTVTSQAQANTSPVSPNERINILIGAVVGIAVGATLALFLELLDKTVKDEKYVVDEMGLPIIGAISEMTNKETESGRRVVLKAPIAKDTTSIEDKKIGRRSRRQV